MPFEALGRGIMAWRAKQQLDKENARADEAAKLQQQQAQFNQTAENRRLEQADKEFGLRTDIFKNKLKPFDPTSVPAGMNLRKLSMTPDGYSADIAPPPPPLPPGFEPSKATMGPNGMEIDYSKPVSTPGSQVVERTLPDGTKGMFISDIDPKTGAENLRPYNKPEAPGAPKPLDTDAIRKLETMALLDKQIPELEKLISETGDSGGPVSGRVQSLWSGFDPQQTRFKQNQTMLLAPVAKGLLGETGVLSEKDEARYSSLFPQYSDTASARQLKLSKLKQLLSDARASTMSTLQGAGRDVSALAPAPQSPEEAIIQQARDAIAKGVPVDEVLKRIQMMNQQTNAPAVNPQ